VCTDSSPIKVFRSAYARQCESAWRAENRLDPRLQLRRRRGRLCQNTCHGFPPAIRTRTVAWRHGASLPATGAASLDPRTNERRPSHQQASRIAPTSVPLAPASVDLAPPTARTAAFRLCAPARQRESVWRSGKPPRSAPLSSAAGEGGYAKALATVFLRPHGLALAHSRGVTAHPSGDRSRKPRPSPPRASTRRTSKLRASHQRVSPSHQQASRVAPTPVALAPYCPYRGVSLVRGSAPARIRMALRKTASIRAPQLRRLRGRLCQSTCHGFRRATRTRTVAWRGVTAHPASAATVNLSPRTDDPRASRQHASSLAPRASLLAPASFAHRTNECRPRTSTRRGPHQQASSLAPRASLLAPTSVALAPASVGW